MKINTFEVEQWMDDHETWAKYNIAETCCASVSITDLLELSEMKAIDPIMLLQPDQKQTYGEIRGNPALRSNLANLYSARSSIVNGQKPLTSDHILIQPGAIASNFLVLYTLIGPGDHVICHHPTYQQLYSVPETLGAEVDLWKAKPENDWNPTFEDLKALIQPNTKLIIVNNPNNPTGAALKKPLLDAVAALAEEHNITILADEVYRPIFHGITPMSTDFPPSMISMSYPNIIVTGSMSKAYSLAGIRVGWIATRNLSYIERFARTRDYTNISVSQLDQNVAAFALSSNTLHSLLGRNVRLAKTNLEILEAFVEKHRRICTWVKPVAGTTAFVKFERDGKPINAVEFCKTLQEKTGVMFLPGDRGFGKEFEGYVRIGYVPETSVVKEGLAEVEKFMRTDFEDVPTM